MWLGWIQFSRNLMSFYLRIFQFIRKFFGLMLRKIQIFKPLKFRKFLLIYEKNYKFQQNWIHHSQKNTNNQQKIIKKNIQILIITRL